MLDTREPPVLGATVYAQAQGMGPSGMQVIKLPTSALRQEGKNSAVWVLDPTSMALKSQTIQIATADGNEAVFAAGLLVVRAGVHVLSLGQKVTICKPKVAVVLTAPLRSAINSIAIVATTSAPASAAN